jgi:hypothetical protein
MKKQAKTNSLHSAFYGTLFLILVSASACEKGDFQLAEEPSATSAAVFQKVGMGADVEWVVEPGIIPGATVEGVSLAEEKISPATVFSYDLMLSYCFGGGATVRVDLANPEEYVFLWEVDGGHGGHDSSSIACICGTSATVHVTRLSDGVKISRTAALPACEDEQL